MATRLREFAELVHVELADATVRAAHDAVGLQQHQPERRIVWLTQGGTTEPARQAGARVVGNDRVRASRNRVEHVDAHVFAENRETTEMLLDNLIAAVGNTLNGVVEMPTYRWESEEPDEAGRARRTAHCVLRINLRLPVPDEIRPLHPITGVEDVCGTLDEGGEIVPQP